MKGSEKFSKSKSGIATDYLIWILIGVAILVIVLIAIGIMGGEGNALIERIKNIFSFR